MPVLPIRYPPECTSIFRDPLRSRMPIKSFSKTGQTGNQLGVFAGSDSVPAMLPSFDAPMSRSPLYSVDSSAGSRIAAANRARNREATAEFEATFEKISAGLRAWQVALHRSTQYLEAFDEVR